MRWLVVGVVVAGCGGEPEAPVDAAVVVDVAVIPDAGFVCDPVAQDCPDDGGDEGKCTFLDPTGTGNVRGCVAVSGDVQRDQPCQRIAEGQCYCGVEQPCSGADMSGEWADQPPVPTTWQCTPRPPAVRADGCPGGQVQGACTTEGQRCGYGACCYDEYTCRSGSWERTGGGCPP